MTLHSTLGSFSEKRKKKKLTILLVQKLLHVTYLLSSNRIFIVTMDLYTKFTSCVHSFPINVPEKT